MAKGSHVLPSDVRGCGRLVVDATLGVTGVVEEMHANIARGPWPFGARSRTRARGLSGLVYGAIRGTTRLVGTGLDAALGSIQTVDSGASTTAEREAAIAVVNGVVGDHLARTGNPLAIPMALRRDGRPVQLGGHAFRRALPAPSSRLLVLAHGLCMSDLGWRRGDHDHGARLAADMGGTAIYLHYNSGLHVSVNGRELAERLEELVDGWPVAVDALTILGHSMGGLVARSACHYGAEAGHGWRTRLRHLMFLGTPHHGAPLERAGNWLQTAVCVSRYSAGLGRLGRLRSAGITDLRHGSLLDDDWMGRDRFAHNDDERRPVPLPDGVACFAVAASLHEDGGVVRESLVGDGLVPVASALGRHADARLALDFPIGHQLVVTGRGHMGLLDRRDVYEQLRRWIA